MAITAHHASNIRLLWQQGFDTFAISAEFNMPEGDVYNYIAAWIERKANRCRDIRSSFAAMGLPPSSAQRFETLIETG